MKERRVITYALSGFFFLKRIGNQSPHIRVEAMLKWVERTRTWRTSRLERSIQAGHETTRSRLV